MNSITGNHLIFIEETDSSNEALKLEELRQKLPEGTVLYTNFQQKGKGQLEAKWESNANENLLLSVLYHPQFLKIEEQMYLNIAVSIACRQFLADLMPAEKIEIKWPNDLVVRGAKIAGILIESSIAGTKLKSSIVGIGININQTKFAIENACSYASITNQEMNLADARKKIFHCLDAAYTLLQMRKFEQLKNLYEAHLLHKSKAAKFIVKGEELTGQIMGIGNQGKLFVMIDGEIKSFMNKELVYCTLKSENE